MAKHTTDGQGFSTRAIHAGEHADPTTGAHNTPIYQTTTYAFDSLTSISGLAFDADDGSVWVSAGNIYKLDLGARRIVAGPFPASSSIEAIAS